MKPMLGAAASILTFAAAVAQAWDIPPPYYTRPVEWRAIPMDRRDPARTYIGPLVYAGGVAMTSSRVGRFGGLSGLEVEVRPDGGQHAYAITDAGDFLSFDLQLGADGRLNGVGQVSYAALREHPDQPLRGKGDADAEDLAMLGPDSFAVSFEQNHRIVQFDGLLSGAEPKLSARNMPAEIAGYPGNRGMEALAIEGETMLVGAENGRMWRCPLPSGACTQVHGRGGPMIGYFLTSLDSLPGAPNEFVALYRQFNPLSASGWFRAIIAHVVLHGDKAAVTTLGLIAPPTTVANMEGISAVIQNGGYRLYVVSDNGLSEDPTLLMAFDWRTQTQGR